MIYISFNGGPLTKGAIRLDMSHKDLCLKELAIDLPVNVISGKYVLRDESKPCLGGVKIVADYVGKLDKDAMNDV